MVSTNTDHLNLYLNVLNVDTVQKENYRATFSLVNAAVAEKIFDAALTSERSAVSQLEKWKELLDTAKAAGLLESFEKTILARLNDECISNRKFCPLALRVFKANTNLQALFLKLFATRQECYYTKSDFQALTENFVKFLDIIDGSSAQIGSIADTVACYDQGGKEWLKRVIETLETAQSIDQQVTLLSHMPDEKRTEEASFTVTVKEQYRDIPETAETWGTLSANRLAARLLRQKDSSNRYDLLLGANDHLSSEELEGVFDETEKKELLAIVAKTTDHKTQKGTVLALIEWSKQIKETFGDEIAGIVINAKAYQEKTHKTKDINAFLQKLLELEERSDKWEEDLFAFDDGKMSFGELQNKLKAHQEIHYREKFPEKDFSCVMHEFSTPMQGGIENPLPKESLDHINTHFVEVISSYREKLKSKSIDALAEEAKAIFLSNKGKETSIKDRWKLLSIAREAIRKTFGLYPYNTQVCAAMAMMLYPKESSRGQVALMRTGEGKSTVSTMLAFVKAFEGKPINIISSAHYLAIRDQKKYAPFFKNFGITTSHICENNPAKERFNAQILYGINTDFEFALLRDGLSSEEKLIWDFQGKTIPRKNSVKIVDEADNLFIDNALSSARISISGRKQLAWIYQPIADFIKSEPERIEQFLKKPENSVLLGELRSKLYAIQEGRYRQIIEKISDTNLRKWVSSAYEAFFQLNENEEYIIKPIEKFTLQGKTIKRDIVIMDKKNTGRSREGSRWQNGLHQFLQLKHGLEIEEEDRMPASICHPVYFDGSGEIYGLTGTVGSRSEREELKTVYQLETFDVPPHKRCIRETLAPVICSDAMHSKEIISKIQSCIERGRPVLVLLESIKETEDFSQKLQAESIYHLVLNERQQESEEYIIAKAGAAGMVTVATHAAGRGTDIILSKESLENGGLHVELGMLPANDRVRLQGEGRAARQGQPGSSRIVISFSDYLRVMQQSYSLTEAIGFLNNSELAYEKLREEQEEQIVILSKRRIEKTKMERENFRYLKAFFTDIKNYLAALNDSYLSSLVDKLVEAITKEQPEAAASTSAATELEGIIQQLLPSIKERIHAKQEASQDLNTVLELIREAFLEEIKYLWADAFYDKLDDLFAEVDENSNSFDEKLNTYKNSLESMYKAYKQEEGSAFSDIKKSFIAHIEKLTGLELSLKAPDTLSSTPSSESSNDHAEESNTSEESSLPSNIKPFHIPYVRMVQKGDYNSLNPKQKRRALRAAVRYGMTESLEKFVAEEEYFVKKHLNEIQEANSENRLIHIALTNKHEKIALCLMGIEGFDPTVTNKAKETAPFLAAKLGLIDVLCHFLNQNDFDPTQKNASNVTLLMEAARGGHQKVVELLLENQAVKADVHSVSDGNKDFLQCVLQSRNLDLLRFALSLEGLDVNGEKKIAANTMGKTCTPIIAWFLSEFSTGDSFSQEALKLLLRYPGIDVNKSSGRPPLQAMLWDLKRSDNPLPLLQILREDGRLNINAQACPECHCCGYKNTAMHHAVYQDRLDIVSALLRFPDIDLNLRARVPPTHKNQWQTAFTAAIIKAKQSNNSNVLKALCAHLGIKSYNDLSPKALLNAAPSKELKLQVLESGLIDVNARNRFGYPILHEAINAKDFTLVEALTAYKGTDINAVINKESEPSNCLNGLSAIEFAFVGSTEENVLKTATILAKNADYDFSKGKVAPIHHAVTGQYLTVIKFLLTNSDRLGIHRENCGSNAWMWAVTRKWWKIADLFLKHAKELTKADKRQGLLKAAGKGDYHTVDSILNQSQELTEEDLNEAYNCCNDQSTIARIKKDDRYKESGCSIM